MTVSNLIPKENHTHRKGKCCLSLMCRCHNPAYSRRRRLSALLLITSFRGKYHSLHIASLKHRKIFIYLQNSFVASDWNFRYLSTTLLMLIL